MIILTGASFEILNAADPYSDMRQTFRFAQKPSLMAYECLSAAI
jgi:hypothetical protein